MYQAMTQPQAAPNPNIFAPQKPVPANAGTQGPNPNIFGQPNLNAMTPGNVQAPQITPAQASGAGDFQRYEAGAMDAAKRNLDPTWDRNQKTFDQTMVNKGIAGGSDAYNEAYDQFNRSKNDQYNSAAFGAQQMGLQAQNQAFGQSLANANLGQQGNMFNAGNQLSSDIFNQNFGLQDREANRSWDLNETNMLGNLDLAYGDRDYRDQVFNAQRDDVSYNRLASILSGLTQQATPQTDVMGAYGLNTSANNAAYNAGMGNQQAGMGGLINLIGSGMNLYGSMG